MNPFEIIAFILITIIFLFIKLPFGYKLIISIIAGIICGMLGAWYDNKNGGDGDVDKTA